MTLLRHTVVFLLWIGCTTCKASAGAACEDPPLIDFGEIASEHESGYKEGDRVQYVCNPGYTLSGSEWVTCHENIWVPGPPQCLAPCTITKQELETQNLLLSNGQRRAFLIQSGQWQKFMCVTGFKLTASPVKQCFNGSIQLPLCVTEKPCDYPAIENGKLSRALEDSKNYYFPMRIGQQVDYHCNDGYSTPTGAYWVRVACSTWGWSPEPKCLKKCRVRQLENGYFARSWKNAYTEGERVKYICNDGYQTENEDGEVTCTKDDWSPPPRCIHKKMACGSIPKVANAQIEGRNKEIYEPGETIHYQCDAGFLTVGPPEIICRGGNWTAPPFCEDVTCGAAPEIPNAYITSTQQERYLPGARVQYECDSHFQMIGGNSVTCTNGEWSQAPTCKDVTCDPPPEIAGGKVQGVKKSRYLPGESARYQCWQGFQMTGTSAIVCRNGTWTKLPKCKGKGGRCGPPPAIENGDLLSFPLQEYPQGATLQYKCPSLYVLEGSQYITCTDGQWSSPPVCLVACTASEEDMGRNNIELKWTTGRKLYSRSGDFVEFRCKRGYLEDPASPPFRVQCMTGTLQYPQCKLGMACTASEEDMGRNNIELKWTTGRKLYIKSGDFVEFRCKRGYLEDPASSPFRVQCMKGTLQYPQCKPGRNCTVQRRMMEMNNIQLQTRTPIYLTGDYISFECKWFHRQVSHPEKFRAKCLDGEIEYPTCEPRFG